MSRKGTEEYIIGRECDEPMARSKGLLPCEKDCRNCMACIEIIETGERRHCNRHNGDLVRKFIQANNDIEEMIMRKAVKWSKEEELLLKLPYRHYTKCYEHHIYYLWYTRRANEKKRKGYAELGLCRICGKPTVEGKKFCAEHLEQYREKMRKAQARRMELKNERNKHGTL